MNEIPKFHETFNPILEILKEGNPLPHRELITKVMERFYLGLPSELLKEKTKSGEILIENRIAWGKSYLKKGGYIFYPKRGIAQITEKGLIQAGKLSLSDVESDSGLMDFYIEEKTKGISEETEIKSSTPQDLIDHGISVLENQTKSDLLEKLKSIDPYYFEKVVLILFKKMGYGDFIETPKSGDGGIDGIINEDKLGLDKIYIQAKRFDSNKVREKDIRNFIGAMSGDTSKGIFVTTSEFDKGAIDKARFAHHTIILIDGKKLVNLMHEYEIGVQIKAIYKVKELDEDFFEGQ